MDACGGGLARQLSNKYNELEKSYAKFCEEHHYKFTNLGGKVFYYNNYKIIANIFSQKENFDTDYENMEIALEQVKNFANKYNMSVAIPYGIGCGIANGDWEKVYKIIEKVFSDYNVILYRLEEKMTRKEQKYIVKCAGGFCKNCNEDIQALEETIQDLKKLDEIETMLQKLINDLNNDLESKNKEKITYSNRCAYAKKYETIEETQARHNGFLSGLIYSKYKIEKSLENYQKEV